MKRLDSVIAVLLVATTLSVGGVTIQAQKIVNIQDETDRKRSDFLSQRLSLFTSLDDSRFLEANGTAFKDILEESSANSKRKIEWINFLKSAGSQLNLAEMSFEIYPSRSITQAQDELMVSVGVELIELKLSLMHDGKLSEFMNYLNAYAQNEFVVPKLAISRVERVINNGITTPKMINLEAFCTIKYYSIDAVGDGDVSQS